MFLPLAAQIIAPRSIRRQVVASLLTLAMISGVALPAAAAAVTVPNAVSPGQAEKRFETPSAPPSQLELNLPAPIENQEISKELREQLEKNKFTLKSVVIEGSTVFKPEDLAFAYQDKIGQTVSLLDAKLIAASITQFYQKHGYVLSQAVVPAQNVGSGVLKIRVIEGYIGNVVIQGDVNDGGEHRILESYAAKIKAMRPVTIQDMERYMLLMNDLPGATVTGLIHPSTGEVGSADMVLTVSRKMFEGSYQFDNRGSQTLGPWEHTATVAVNSLFNEYDRTSVRLATVDPMKELFGAQIQHDELLDDEGTKLSLLGAHTVTQPRGTALIDGLDVNGTSDLYEAQVSHPFLRLREETFVGRATFDLRNTQTDVFSGEPLTDDRMRILRVGGNYNFLDTWRGNNTFDVQLSQGMNIFNASSGGDNRSNPIGDSAFTKTNFDMSRLQALPNDFSVLVAATGQYSFEPLLTDEQFSLGGTEYGRAFDPAELLGDSGLAGKAELRYTQTPPIPYLKNYQLYTYYDIGEVWVRGAASGSDALSLSSVGVGTRVNVTDYISSSLELSAPVITPPDDQTGYRHDPRIFFTLAAHY